MPSAIAILQAKKTVQGGPELAAQFKRVCSNWLGQPTSTLSTFTITLKGNGEIVLASVIGGTAARPFSDEVCVIMVWIAFVRVAAKAVRAFSRSGYRNKLDGIGHVCR